MFRKYSSFILATGIALASGVLSACSTDGAAPDDKDGGVDASTGGVSSTGGRTNPSGGTATGNGGSVPGSGGTPMGGAKGSGGASNIEAGADAATVSDASNVPDASNAPDASNPPDAGEDAGSPDADGAAHEGGTSSGRPRLALAGVTDYQFADFASIDLATGNVLQRWATEGSAVPVVHDGVGFVVEHNNGIIDTLDHEGLFFHRINLNLTDAGGAGNTFLDPHDVVPVPGTAKAYVSLHNANNLEIVDVDAASISGLVDLSQFLPPGQEHVSTDMGVYDPTTQRVYFALQRLGSTSFCADWPALLIGIDPATDKIVDLNGAADGVAIPLALAQPVAVTLQNDHLYVLATGCSALEGEHAYIRQGIEVVTLSTATTAAAYTTTEQNYALGLTLLNDSTAVVSRNTLDYLSVTEHLWTLGGSTLGAALPGAPPLGATVESADTLVGVQSVPVEGGALPAFVRYTVSTGALSFVAPDAWALNPISAANPAGVIVVR